MKGQKAKETKGAKKWETLDFSFIIPYFMNETYALIKSNALSKLAFQFYQASYGAKITQELCPPKPKELLIAAVTLCSFLTLAHVSIPVTTSSHSF